MNTHTQQGLPVTPYSNTQYFSVLSQQSLDGLGHTLPVSKLIVDDPESNQMARHFVCTTDETSVVINHVLSHLDDTKECYVTVVQTAQETNTQKDIENTFYHADFHLDVREWLKRDYAPLTDNRRFTTTTFRRIKQTGHSLCTLANLLDERDLHMDMLREFSSRSDGHVYRYAFAQSFIRPGDNLLDCACGLGYGSYLMSLNDSVSHVTGVDICVNSVGYANQVYGHDKLNYQTLDIDEYADTNFEAFDLITSFETIEHVKDYHSFFKLCLRCLKPDGRVIASVPYMWVDETGKDPNPYHFHEFDWHKFKNLFEQYGFLIEARYHQTAPGGFKLPQSPRRFEKSAIEAPETETEWLVVVATPDLTHPLWAEQQKFPYQNPQYAQGELPQFVDFASGYANPWLHRQVVQVGQRIQDSDVRLKYVSKLLQTGSSDTLMLLTLMGYGLPKDNTALQRNWLKQASDGLEVVLSTDLMAPFTLRWYVSLAFLAACKYLENGEFAEASRYFLLVTRADCSAFCSVLNIKAIESHYFLAKIALLNDQSTEASQHLAAGKAQIFAATEVFKHSIDAQQDLIADFLWSEMAELYDAGALLNKFEIALERALDVGEILRQCSQWEQNKRFGLFNLVEKYRKSSDLTFQADMQLVAQSYINKLVTKLAQLANYDRIFIWGTGVVALQLHKALSSKGIDVAGFIDSQARLGQSIDNIPVFSPELANLLPKDTVILTSVGSSKNLAEPLESQGIQCVYMA
ncbi:class I SAM-dependent methyltransferase [Alteromonas sp. KUL49]|uniref:class I SAM-dependent methyltransferase n=1 Tax=Alteromonas sp. KUL49 TaxID=2480798 RepID=UPI00102F002C|nr:class I SAM-dependent methyltransferase [Alteromonas sp. KUL49]TAP39681.1 methyltransferase domain-containing protein [Alteromonas sp. KUL49]GEA11668.1 hypothetical protein KUL49_20430 [Alteromonas sp. KUL49]